MTVREIRVDPGAWDPVVSDPDGAQLIVAGPGTGKTEFLVQRVAHIVKSGRARRDQISLLTFSRRASSDMRRRVGIALGGSGVPVDASTFHSLALRFLEAANEGERPVPLTPPEQVALVGELLAKEDPTHWPLTYRGILNTRAFASEIADFLTRCSERLLSPADLEQRAEERADWRGIPGLFRRYRETLEKLERTDYGTLLVSAVELLATARGQDLAAGFRYVIVDEYQDTSSAQAELAGLLSRSHGNLTVAGDPYQSIYSFRGAELRNIAQFANRYQDVTRIVLDQSLRVPAEILEAAVRVVSSGELPGSAGPVRPAEHRGRVEAYVFDQETAEADWIAREVEHVIRVEGTRPSAVAVLVRSKRELINELSRALDRRSIPHDSPDSRLVDHPAVRVFDDLARVAVLEGDSREATPGERADADRAMRRILLGPLVSLGLGQERALLRQRRRSDASWAEVVATELPGRTDLAELLADPAWAGAKPATDGFWQAWNRMLGVERLVADPDRRLWRLAIAAFAQVLTRQAERDEKVTLSRFFEMTQDEGFESEPLLVFRPQEDRVTLTTLHQSKGLEYDVVFIANAVEGVFPDLRRSRRMLRPELLSPERTTDASAQHLFQVQEEMRLAYTAMTRARFRVVWTATGAVVDQGEHRPSRFLVAASGVDSISDLGRPADDDRDPVTLIEAEVSMRRTLFDPEQKPAHRLAAARVLGSPPESWWEASAFAGVREPGPDQPIIGGELRLSPSQADAYATCPRRYALERRLRLGDAGSPYARFGTLVHSAMERAEAEVVGTGETHADLEDALGHLRRVWDEDADFGTPELNAAWLRQAETALTKLYTRWPSPGGEPVGLEMRVESVIAGTPWIGLVDRLERTPHGLKVVDYKTSKSATSIEDAKSSIQLAFYASAIAQSFGEPVIGAEMWFPRVESVKVTTRPLDLDRLTEIEETMIEVTNAIRSEQWEPRVGDGCKNCVFKKSCPAWPEGQGAFLP
ncbi:MAG TPA: ATP-dependent DNA helicase [Acidimicrobiia bacterium]|nr:ATP-dependent DNA helicase [Acidimicrobiia bacterium]